MAVKYSVVFLLFLCCTAIQGQRVQPTRKPPSQTLVDVKPGYSPLYQSTDETKRRTGNYIIKLKDTTDFDDLGRIMAKMTTQAQRSANSSDDEKVVVQALSGFSVVGQGVMATLNQNALDAVSTINTDKAAAIIITTPSMLTQLQYSIAYELNVWCYPDIQPLLIFL